MNKILKAAALAVALSGVSTAFAADVVVRFDPGVVQYGYTDGYWTRSHEWHAWEHPDHVKIYRSTPNAQYYEYRHDRDADMGWRVR